VTETDEMMEISKLVGGNVPGLAPPKSTPMPPTRPSGLTPMDRHV